MALDSSIALQYKAPQFDNPLAQFAQVAQIKNAQQQNRLAELAFGEKEREIGESRALNDAYKNALAPDGTIDRNKLYTGAASAGLGSKLPAIQKGFADQDKAAADAFKQKLENGIAEIEFGARVFSGVKDQASYDVARQIIAQKLGPDRAAKMPAVYDPAAIEANRMQALSIKDQMEQQWKAAHFGLDQQKFAYQQTNDAASRGVTVRGQDISQQTAMRGQDITVRGQNLTNERALETLDTKREENQIKREENGGKLTEFQGKSTAFAARAQEADKLIASLDGKYSPAAINSKASAESTPLIGGILGAGVNKMALSPGDRKADQAQRDFINAVLRQESGAAIGADEFDNARKQYFTQPGDDAGVIAQKASNRRLAIEGLKTAAGPGAKSIDGMVDRSKIDLTKVKPGTPEYKAVIADAEQIGALRNQSKPKIVDFGSLK